MKLGNSIKIFRKNRSLTQSQLAEMCEISTTYLSLIESEKKEPALPLVKVIAEKLNIPLPILIFSAITNEDIPENKKELFEILKPSVDSILNNLVNDNADSEA